MCMVEYVCVCVCEREKEYVFPLARVCEIVCAYVYVLNFLDNASRGSTQHICQRMSKRVRLLGDSSGCFQKQTTKKNRDTAKYLRFPIFVGVWQFVQIWYSRCNSKRVGVGGRD